jgi:hypothetical protein
VQYHTHPSTNNSPTVQPAFHGQLATRRTDPVCCPICGRVVPRRARQQRFCSTKCREQGKVPRKNRNKKSAPLPPYLKATEPLEKANGFNVLRAQKSGSRVGSNVPREAIEAEIFGGREWQQVVSPDGVVCEVAVLRPRTLQSSQRRQS